MSFVQNALVERIEVSHESNRDGKALVTAAVIMARHLGVSEVPPEMVNLLDGGSISPRISVECAEFNEGCATLLHG